MNVTELDALSLEYQRDYGTATGNLDISDVVNNPFANSVVSIFSLCFPEELSDLPPREICVLGDDVSDSSLVA